MMTYQRGKVAVIITSVVSSIFLLALLFFIWPQYKVWQQGMEGQAELKRAEQNRQVKVLEAQATLDSAKLLGDAEVERAKGVAKANAVIGDSLKGNEGYLRYLWILGLQTNQMQVVYVPTEAGLPVLEAGAGRLSGGRPILDPVKETK